MSYDQDKLVREFTEMASKGDWSIYARPRKEIGQYFINERDAQGLIDFYWGAIEKVIVGELRVRIQKTVKITEDLSEMMKRSLDDAVSFAKRNDRAKSVYIEYGEVTIDYFVCDSFDATGEDWASNYFHDIEGPQIASMFEYYDWEIGTLEEALIKLYADSLLLTESFRGISESDKKRLSFGFAEHDSRIILF